MKYSELQTIIQNGAPHEWLYDDGHEIYTYKDDLNLRIEKREVDLHGDHFSEEWATKHADSEAYSVIYEVFYGSSFVLSYKLVAVDGFRATLPLPSIGSSIIPRSAYQFARIVSKDRLDEYIKRSGLSVGD